jgi:hypothetical protein
MLIISIPDWLFGVLTFPNQGSSAARICKPYEIDRHVGYVSSVIPSSVSTFYNILVLVFDNYWVAFYRMPKTSNHRLPSSIVAPSVPESASKLPCTACRKKLLKCDRACPRAAVA